MKKPRRLKDLPSNQPPADLVEKPETEWSRFRVKKATVEEDAGDHAHGKIEITASDRKGCSDLYGAIIRKPDLLIETTDGTRQEFGKITRLVITAGKKPETVHGVATVRTSPKVEDLVARSVKISSRQMDLPAGETEAQG